MIQKESANTFYARDNKPPATLIASIKKTPNRPRTSLTTTLVAAPWVPLLLPLPLVLDPLPEDGAVGTNVPVALARQELATRLAFEELDALAFTVPFPPKLHAWGFRLFASKYSLITKESLVEGSHEDTSPYCPVVPLAAIVLQLPPAEPRREQAVSRSGPRIAVVLETCGLN